MSGAGTHVVAISGGKDSTAMALALKEREPRDYVYLCTPTGNELPEMLEHWDRLEALLGTPIMRLTNRTLEWWIDEQKALPSFRMRWCTRKLKIEPCHAFMARLDPPVTLYVGLRADEPEREGVEYGGPVTERYPMREWGWSLADVVAYLRNAGVTVPRRSDCAWCYDQRIGEWYRLWKDNPEIYQAGVDTEAKHGHTFRSGQRDTWPAGLAELRREFEGGRVPKDVLAEERRQRLRLAQPSLLDDEDDAPRACRVCRL